MEMNIHDLKFIKIANNWIDQNRNYFRNMNFNMKELVQMGKNFEAINR